MCATPKIATEDFATVVRIRKSEQKIWKLNNFYLKSYSVHSIILPEVILAVPGNHIFVQEMLVHIYYSWNCFTFKSDNCFG